MISAIKAEFRKLLTVRSTYFVTTLVILLVAFIAFYVEGWRLLPKDLNSNVQLASDVTGALNLVVFGAVIAILSMTHEYRYNTITYTLSGSNSRSKILLAKIITISCYALALTLVIGVLSPIMSYLGVHASGHALVPQVLNYKDLIWRSLFYGWAYGLVGLLLATLIRIQAGALVALFIIPSAVESLLGLLLKHNAVYMPFTALSQVIGTQSEQGGSLSPAKGALVFGAYLVFGWIVAWYLFLRRDAN